MALAAVDLLTRIIALWTATLGRLGRLAVDYLGILAVGEEALRDHEMEIVLARVIAT